VSSIFFPVVAVNPINPFCSSAPNFKNLEALAN
jgi:hypothetical protein